MGQDDKGTHGGLSSSGRLAASDSPYLRQHAHQPVDWYPWGPEALEKAREADLPIFASIGYAACHWCHVMAHESFDNAEVGRLLNRHFVPVKVDREERPDLDEIYMAATHVMTGRGGWPNSVWLTPDGRPWYAATYVPLEDRDGRIGMVSLLEALARAWRDRREAVEAQADEAARAVREACRLPEAERDARAGAAQVIERALEQLRTAFDARHGGFGGAPKFPPHGELDLLLAAQDRDAAAGALPMVRETLLALSRGGVYDHVGGGLHRYAVDSAWHVPHFEKMLYDNALFVDRAARAWPLLREAEVRDAALDACEWLLREMQHPDGGFYASLDADSEGEEGRYYVWTADEVRAAAGPRAEAFLRTFGVLKEGNYREEATGRPARANILHRAGPWGSDEAGGCDREEGRAVLRRLAAERARRVAPGLDEKRVAAWNGLAVTGLVAAGRAWSRPDLVQAAARAAQTFVAARNEAGYLPRSLSASGRAGGRGYAEDYAFLALGLLDLHEATGERDRLRQAEDLAHDLLEDFRDTEAGGFFHTARDAESLLARIKPVFDQPVPSGHAGAVELLRRLYDATRSEVYRVMAEEALTAVWGAVARAPRAAPSLLAVCSRMAAARAPWKLP